MAALKAAKPTQPMAAPCGPPLRPSMPPARHPAATPLSMSFLARRPSMPHSMPEKSAPTKLKLRAVLKLRAPISLKPCLSCCRSGRSASGVTVAVAVGTCADAMAAAPLADAAVRGDARRTTDGLAAAVSTAALAVDETDDAVAAVGGFFVAAAAAVPAAVDGAGVCAAGMAVKGVSLAICISV